jgi:predicted dehydrogenase
LVFKLEEALALKELAAAKPDLVLQTGLQRRYSQFYQIARQMVSKGMLGEVTHIQTQWNSNLGWTMRPDQPKEKNWRLLREFSGGLVSERVSHQVDVANWMFGDSPEFVVGVGGLDWKKDGRDVYDNVSLIFRYPYGQKLNATAISTNRHMALLNGTRKESGELIMGTDGSIEITLGDDGQPALGMWFVEPGTKIERAAGKNEAAFPAGATIAQATRDQRGFPILLASDQLAGDESFLAREMKYARRWLYAKGIALPQEDRSAVDAQLEGFFESCQTGKPVKADLDAGINASVATIMANRAMDESRKVLYSEMERKKT